MNLNYANFTHIITLTETFDLIRNEKPAAYPFWLYNKKIFIAIGSNKVSSFYIVVGITKIILLTPNLVLKYFQYWSIFAMKVFS